MPRHFFCTFCAAYISVRYACIQRLIVHFAEDISEADMLREVEAHEFADGFEEFVGELFSFGIKS